MVAAATRTDPPLLETPQAVRVVPHQLIEDTGRPPLVQPTRWTLSAASPASTTLAARDSSFRGFSNTDGSGPAQQLCVGRGLEGETGAVVASGRAGGVDQRPLPLPSMAAASNGGTLNVVSKKPQFTAAPKAGVQVGTLGYKRTTLDSTGPLGTGWPTARTWRRRRHPAAPSPGRQPTRWWWPRPSPGTHPNTVLNYEAGSSASVPAGPGHRAGQQQQVPCRATATWATPARDNLHVNGDTHQFTLDHDTGARLAHARGASYRETDLYGEAVDPDRHAARMAAPDPARQLAQPARDTSVQAEVEGSCRLAACATPMLAGVESWRLYMGQGHSLFQRPASRLPSTFQPHLGRAPAA